jgi:hypothetical protein
MRMIPVLLLCMITIVFPALAQKKDSRKNAAFEGYINNRSPLQTNPYLELPLGAIKPQGWLKEMLIRQKNGVTGQLDALYPLVMSKRNGWVVTETGGREGLTG